MRRQNIPFEHLTDIIAFRIIVPSEILCYQALGMINQAYPMIQNRFRDYISTPKPNGYKSIHTSVVGPKHLRIEIQIKTNTMHQVAENGVAAHWCYKQTSSFDPQQYAWLRSLLDILKNNADPEAFLDHTKMEMFQEQVFCFSPHGDLFILPYGAMPLDFAYTIHPDLGNAYASAKINGKIVPKRIQIKNGDQIEIITSSVSSPSSDWENFVVTGKAKSYIRRSFNDKVKKQYIKLGSQMLEKTFEVEGVKFVEQNLKKVCPHFKVKNTDNLLQAVGKGVHDAYSVFKQFTVQAEKVPRIKSVRENIDCHAISLRGLTPGMAVHFEDCCFPIPGDKIVGIINTGYGVIIHRLSCYALRKFDKFPERWVDVAWDEKISLSQKHIARLNSRP